MKKTSQDKITRCHKRNRYLVSIGHHYHSFRQNPRRNKFLFWGGLTATAIILIVIQFSAHTLHSQAAGTKTWSAAADGNWETAGNWTPSGAPAAGDTVVFDATSIKNCTVTTFTSGNGIVDGIGSISLNTGYTGILNFQKKPSQNADPYKINITGDFTINAGTVTTDGDTTVANGQGNEFDAANLTVGVGRSFNADGKGFTAGNGPGKGSNGGYGASYGGEGYGAASTAAYGDYSNPVSLGSGGSGAGGGAIILSVTNTATISGTVSVNGSNDSGSGCGGGGDAASGGTVNISANQIAGGGTILAIGGNVSCSGSGVAGGGRIKLAATTISYNGSISAAGGKYGSIYGSAGTVFKKTTAQTYGDLIINNGANTPGLTNQYAAHLKTSADTGSYQFDSITASGYGRLAIDTGQTLALDSGSITGDKNSGFINAGTVTAPASWTMGYMFSDKSGTVTGLSTKTITISSTGRLTNYPNPAGASEVYKLNWTVSALTVQATGEINTNGLGFTSGNGPGHTSLYIGSSYGGEGGNGAAVTKVYGDYSNPVNLGSGGYDIGGINGGGAIILNITNTLDIMGTISANGTAAPYGGATGGSVNLTAATISNSGGGGGVTANGGSSSSSAGGSGGRVKLGGTTLSYNGTLTATGGGGSGAGSAGTVFKKTAAQSYGDLIIDNTGNTPGLTNQVAAHLKASTDTGSYQFDSITCSNSGRLAVDTGQTLALDSGSITGDKNSGFINAGTVTSPASWTIGYMFSDKTGTVTGLSGKTIIISSAGRLTNYPNPAGASEVYKLNWTVSTLTVQASGEINTNGVGFTAGNGPGYTGTNTGSSYGGEGGGAAVTKVYGDYSNPVNLGSGSYSNGGGGAIILNVTNTLDIMGTISANCTSSNSNGGGSGGSVNLTAATISSSGGGGSITANGSGSTGVGSGGSGGRVKLSGTTLSYNGTLTATGGSGSGVGSAGTIYKKTTAQSYGDLIINNGANTPGLTNQAAAHLKTSADTGSYQFDSITCSNYGRLMVDAGQTLALDSGSITGDKNSGFINAGTVTAPGPWTLAYFFSDKSGTITNLSSKTITISSTGRLTHYTNTNTETYKLNWTVSALTVQATGEINVSSVGFTAGTGPGYTGTNTGSSYGGEGGGAAVTKVYGDCSNPVNLGSGGYSFGGGGAIILNVTNTLDIMGTISANATGGSNGGATGGSVNLTAATISNSGGGGGITANGAASSVGGGGSGGRVKLSGTTLSYNGTLTATGGSGSGVGSAGTIYKKTAAQSYGDLIIDNGTNTGATTAYTPITTPLQLDSVAVKNYGKFELDTNATATSDTLTTTGDINVTAHGEMKLMSDNDGTPAKGAGMTVTAANVSTDATSSIHSNGQGFIHDAGYSNGKGLVGTLRGGGGAFGGAGGASNDGGAGGQVYGSTTDVAYVGSGGGAANLGGQGGGLIIMNVSGTITNAGTISVNGNVGTTNGGGAAGGGLQIATNNIASTGTISANGGNGATNAGGGGGGRIYIVSSGTHSISPAPTASGGTGANAGLNGTVTFQLAPAAPIAISPLGTSAIVYGTNWIATDSGNNWGYRQVIVIDHTKVGSGGVSNFPVLLTGASMDAGLWTQAKADGSDLRVTSSNITTEVNFNLVSFSPSDSSMELWFLASSLSDSVDTTFYLYWGNAGASAKATAWGQGVWGSDYKAVYHLGNSTNLSLIDSSSGGNDLTNSGTTTTTGQVSGGASFNGSGAKMTKGSSATVPTGTSPASLEMWFKMNSSPGAQDIGGWGANSTGTRFAAWYDNNNLYVDGCSTSRSFSWTADTNWHHLVFTIANGNLNTEHAYLDGIEKTLSAVSGTLNISNSEIKLGGVPTSAGYYFGGTIDEFRIKGAVNNQAWVTSEFNNQNSPTTFIPSQPEVSSSLIRNTALNVSPTTAFTFSTTDPNGDYLRYKFQLATDSGFTQNLSEFVEGSDAGGQTQTSNDITASYSGQDAESSTAYASGTTATLTISGSTPLTNGVTYYWRVYAIDPGGSNSWSSPSSTLAIQVLPFGPIDHFTLTAYSTSVVAGSVLATGPTVTAYDASNNVKTDYTGQVWFTSSDGAAALTYNSGSHYTFVGGDNGVKAFNGSDVILKTTDNQTITLKNDGGAADVTSTNILVSPTTLDHFTIVTSATTATAGSALPNTVNATAYDVYNNTKTDYTGQVWFTSSDSAANLTYNPGNHYTFVGGDNGSKTFLASAFVFNTIGNQTITLKNGDGKADVTTGNILVSAGGIDHITIAPNSLTLNSGDIGQFTATSFDQFNNLRTDTFVWSVAAGGGAIDQSGNFSAGIVGGTFSNTVKASNSGVDGFASVTVNAAATPTPTPTPTSTPTLTPTGTPTGIPSTTSTDTPTPATLGSATPGGSELKTTPIVPTETAPQTSTAKADISLSDFHFYTMLDSGNIELNVSDLSNIEVTNNSNVLIEIPADIFSKEVNVITISTGESTYLMNLLTGKNKYQAVIPMPTVKGQFEFRILIIYKDGTIKEIKKNVTVDPQGYVYTKSSSYFGLGSKQEVRIESAQMTLYKVDNGVSKLVDPTEVKQANPIKTNSSGEYAFYVPNGEYYLVAEKAGYKTVKTDNFKVDNLVVNKNIEMELKVKPWIWLIAAGLAVIAIIFLLIRRRRKTNNIQR